MTLSSLDIERLMLQQLTPAFAVDKKSQPNTEKTCTVKLDSMARATFDADGVADDFTGTAYVLVTEKTEETGWTGSTNVKHSMKRFAYFLKNGSELVLRELNPGQKLNPASGLQVLPQKCGPGSTKAGGVSCKDLTVAEAQAMAAAIVQKDPVGILVGEFDREQPGFEVEVSMRRGLALLGSANLTTHVFGTEAR